MTRRLTQNERIVRMLRATGPRGLTQLDVDPPALDGGPPIRRLASRVNELRASGFAITTTTNRRNKMAVYRLEREPEAPSVTPPAASSAQMSPRPPRDDEARPANAIHGWDGE